MNLKMMIGTLYSDHTAFRIRTGMMSGALEFFSNVGWSVLDRETKGPWGQARFIQGPTGEIVQLTELLSHTPDELVKTDEIHIGLRTWLDAGSAAECIVEWAQYAGAGQEASWEYASMEDTTKAFVYLPALYAFALEIVQLT